MPKVINRQLLAALITTTPASSLLADSPENITTDIKWIDVTVGDIHNGAPPPENFGSVTVIETTFNSALTR